MYTKNIQTSNTDVETDLFRIHVRLTTHSNQGVKVTGVLSAIELFKD